MNLDKHNILICSTSIANYDRRIQRIGRSLHSDGHKVKWCSRAEGQLDCDFCAHTIVNPLVTSGFLFYAFFNIRLFFKLLFNSFDVVYSVDLDTVLPCYLVAKIKRKKIIFDAHEYFTEVPELIERKFVKKVWQGIADLCLPNILNNITVGPELSQIFTERYRTKYIVVRNISPSIKTNIQIPSAKNKLVYLGAVNKGRGIELAIKCLVGLPQKTLRIIGGGDLLKEMKSLAEKHKVADRVEFVGFVAPEEIGTKIEGCYLALNVLMAESQSYYYSLANKFFDYLQFGIPCLNMNFPEYKLLHESYDLGPVVEEYSVQALLEAIQKYDDPGLYASIQKGIKQANLDINWKNEEKRLLSLVNNLT